MVGPERTRNLSGFDRRTRNIRRSVAATDPQPRRFRPADPQPQRFCCPRQARNFRGPDQRAQCLCGVVVCCLLMRYHLTVGIVARMGRRAAEFNVQAKRAKRAELRWSARSALPLPPGRAKRALPPWAREARPPRVPGSRGQSALRARGPESSKERRNKAATRRRKSSTDLVVTAGGRYYILIFSDETAGRTKSS